MPGTKYNQRAAQILKATDLEAFVRNTFTGESLDAELKDSEDRYHLYSKNSCENILNKHGEEIEQLQPREQVISSIQNSGKYDREFVPICQVHDAVYAAMDMMRGDYAEMIEAHPQAPLREIISAPHPDHLQAPEYLKGKANLSDYIESCYLGRDLFRAAVTNQRPVTPGAAAVIYAKFWKEIDAIVEALPAGRRTAWKDVPADKTNLAIISTALELFKQNKDLILNNPKKTLRAVAQEKNAAHTR